MKCIFSYFSSYWIWIPIWMQLAFAPRLNKWKGMILKNLGYFVEFVPLASSCLPSSCYFCRKKLGWFDRIYDPFKSVLFVCVLMPFFIKGEASFQQLTQEPTREAWRHSDGIVNIKTQKLYHDNIMIIWSLHYMQLSYNILIASTMAPTTTTMRSSASCQTIHLSASRFPIPICILFCRYPWAPWSNVRWHFLGSQHLWASSSTNTSNSHPIERKWTVCMTFDVVVSLSWRTVIRRTLVVIVAMPWNIHKEGALLLANKFEAK